MKILLKLVLLTLVIPCYVWSAEQTEWEQARSKYNQLLSERKYDAAIEAAKSALIIAKKEFGSDSKYYASNYGKIGEIYYLKGDYGNALKYMTESLDLKKKAFGDTDVVYSQALHNISTIYQQMGMHKQAEPLLIEAIDIKKKTLGESDTSYAKSIHMLAELYQTIGDYGKSEEQFKKALEIKRKNLGSDNPSLALSIQGLGNLYLALGNFGEASKCYEEIVGIYTKIVGNDSPTTFAAESKLTKIYLSLGETEKANGLIKKSQGNLSKMSPKNPDYVVALYNSAMLHWELKEFAAAEADLKKTLKVLEENYTNTHYLYSSCLSSLGIITWVQGKLKEALQYMGNAAFLREKLYGNNNPILASTYHGFAGMLKEAGDHSKAKEYYKKAFDLYLNQLHVYFPFLSDSEKAKFDAKIKENFNMFNNYVLERYSEDPSLAADLYNYRLATKAILLNSSKKVRESIGSSGNKELIKKFEQWREVRANLSQLYNLSVVELKQQRVDINSLEKTANTLEKEISAMSSEFRNEYSKERVAWRDVKDRLGEGEAAIEIIRFQFFDKGWSDKVYYAFLIVTKETKEYPELIVLDYGNKMENAYIKNYVNSMKFKIDDKDSYGFYWSKIDEKLNGINTIYLSQMKKWFDTRLQQIKWVDGRVVELLLASDVTSRQLSDIKHREEYARIQQTSRLVTMGEMASSLAHELNQPLTAISNYTLGAGARIRSITAKGKPLVAAELLEILTKTARQASRAGSVIKRIRNFVRKSDPSRRLVKPSTIINETIELAEIDASNMGIQIIQKIQTSLPLINYELSSLYRWLLAVQYPKAFQIW